jgi:hypothetical protein
MLAAVALPADLAPAQHLVGAAARARHPVLSLVALGIGGLDPAGAADRRRRHQHDLPVPEGDRALLRELHRVALGAGAERVAVDLVAEQDADRPAREPRGCVGADDGQVPAREALVQDLVRPVPRLRVGDAPGEARRVARHWREAVLPGLGVALGRHHHHDRRRVLIDVVADGVPESQTMTTTILPTCNEDWGFWAP